METPLPSLKDAAVKLKQGTIGFRPAPPGAPEAERRPVVAAVVRVPGPVPQRMHLSGLQARVAAATAQNLQRKAALNLKKLEAQNAEKKKRQEEKEAKKKEQEKRKAERERKAREKEAKRGQKGAGRGRGGKRGGKRGNPYVDGEAEADEDEEEEEEEEFEDDEPGAEELPPSSGDDDEGEDIDGDDSDEEEEGEEEEEEEEGGADEASGGSGAEGTGQKRKAAEGQDSPPAKKPAANAAVIREARQYAGCTTEQTLLLKRVTNIKKIVEGSGNVSFHALMAEIETLLDITQTHISAENKTGGAPKPLKPTHANKVVTLFETATKLEAILREVKDVVQAVAGRAETAPDSAPPTQA
jgi:hypothetical protein